jgi:hypothetical protein
MFCSHLEIICGHLFNFVVIGYIFFSFWLIKTKNTNNTKENLATLLDILSEKTISGLQGMDLTEHGEAAYPVDAWVELQYKNNGDSRPAVPSVMKGAPR